MSWLNHPIPPPLEVRVLYQDNDDERDGSVKYEVIPAIVVRNKDTPIDPRRRYHFTVHTAAAFFPVNPGAIELVSIPVIYEFRMPYRTDVYAIPVSHLLQGPYASGTLSLPGESASARTQYRVIAEYRTTPGKNRSTLACPKDGTPWHGGALVFRYLEPVTISHAELIYGHVRMEEMKEIYDALSASGDLTRSLSTESELNEELHRLPNDMAEPH